MKSYISNNAQITKIHIATNTRAKFILPIIVCAGLAGCAAAPPKPDTRLDGQSVLPKEQVARIGIHTSETFPGRPLNTRWGMTVLAIDGKPVPPGTSVVQVTPGSHDIEFRCFIKFQLNDTGGGTGSATRYSINFQAGNTYYGYAAGQMSSYKSYGAAGIESKGTCTLDRFSTDNPYRHF